MDARRLQSARFFESKPEGGCAVALAADCNVRELTFLATARDLEFRTFGGKQCPTPKQLYDVFAEVLGFPSWFGRNWDALNEVLRDHEFTPKAPTFLLVRDADRLLPGMDEGLAILAGILDRVDEGKAVSHYSRSTDPREYPPFWVLLLFNHGEGLDAFLRQSKRLSVLVDRPAS